jgi:GT2 family glycosyltransferase
MSPLRRKLRRNGHFLLYWLLHWTSLLLEGLQLAAVRDRLLVHAIRRQQLFDRRYYLDRYDDLGGLEARPLLHYIRIGDREGRFPMPLFDPAHYASQAGVAPHSKVNRLLHYACLGRYRGYSPSAWFDLPYYLTRNKDVARSGIDPLFHYLHWGGFEGRDPSPGFSSSHYCHAVPEVMDWGINPLIHYLEQGQYEGRSPVPASDGSLYRLSLAGPVRPVAEEWADVALSITGAVAADSCVDVIVPVYNGADVTLRCILSVLQARRQVRVPHEVIVINDASPDPELTAELEALAARGLFTLLSNDANCGFVATANRGMGLHPDRDVVLLNSDTEVYGDWLDRLRGVVQREQRVATVTPLSNNATLCSYPNSLHDNPYPLEVSYPELDRLAATVNAGLTVEAPTGVGFCLYVARACLDDVGLFDAARYGRGYGEENDFCQRAIRRGWQNLLVGDVFVRHWGAASFQGERARRVKQALELLDETYPRYQRAVQGFMRSDPLRPVRARLDFARLELARRGHNALIVTHARGGGTERHIQEDTARLREAGFGVFLMRPAPRRGGVVLTHPEIDALPNLDRINLADEEAVTGYLTRLGITEIHVHHLIDFDADAVASLPRIAQRMGLPLRMMIHDYTAICPRVNLVDLSGIYCGEPGEAQCHECLKRNGSEFGVQDIRLWRARYGDLLAAADSVVVPDPDVADRLSRYFGTIDMAVQPHEAPVPASNGFELPRLADDERLRVVVIGAIGKIKGYDILLACAKEARKRQLPIDFIVYGYSMNDTNLRREGVRVTGRYLEQHADQGLRDLAPHCIWFPYAWPETYSYTLSIALRSKWPILAFDLGAIASRLRKLGLHEYLMPLKLAREPKRINERFLAYRALIEADADDDVRVIDLGRSSSELEKADWPHLAERAQRARPASEARRLLTTR